MLAQAPHLEIEGECRDACEALACIRQKRPDLVLVDARLNESSGIDLIRQVPEEHRPLVIFTAAVNRYAVEAFEVHALDYLLRPFSQARLNAALERAGNGWRFKRPIPRRSSRASTAARWTRRNQKGAFQQEPPFRARACIRTKHPKRKAGARPSGSLKPVVKRFTSNSLSCAALNRPATMPCCKLGRKITSSAKRWPDSKRACRSASFCGSAGPRSSIASASKGYNTGRKENSLCYWTIAGRCA